MNANEQFECLVCGFDKMKGEPKEGEICPSCGTQFDSEGADDYPKLRQQWIAKQMPWFSRGVAPPRNWSPYHQLIIAGYGSDLLLHPRMKAEPDYRYAVDEAFSDVRIARQLKLLRETRETPLTQSALADRAEMKQSRISELEGMNYSSWTVSTLRRLAKALDLRFSFAFESWRELGPEIEGGLSEEALWKPSFENDPSFNPERAQIRASGTDNTTALIRNHLENFTLAEPELDRKENMRWPLISGRRPEPIVTGQIA